ncbi:hypothetical protein [Parasphingorhabdus pacifica]
MQQLEHAARALGWDGRLVTDIEVHGCQFAAVTRVRHDVHLWRSEHGWAPEPNPTWFRSWSDPDIHDHLPIAAVDLLGVLVPVSRARRALRACGTLMTLAPCAVLLPAPQLTRTLPLMELNYYGIGVVTVDGPNPPELQFGPEDRSAEFGASLFGRWLQEVLYARVLKHDPELADTTGS